MARRSPDGNEDPGKAKTKGDTGGILFRSYAGMTRIRFKGPAQRHLSIV
jgi:hypothetical protein